MGRDRTRRGFLKASGGGIAALAAAHAFPEFSPATEQAGTSPAPSDLALWVTSENRRFSRAPSISWRPASGPAAGDAVVLDPGRKFQSILGFGAAFTDAACYMFSQLSSSARERLFHELFDPSEMGLTVCRICMGASDYSTALYSYDDGDADPGLARFSIDHDRAYILPALREARKVNADLFLFASPWSPPGWMKANGTMLGGSMRRKYMPSYADYFLKFLQGYEAEGVLVQAVTIQNEVDTDQDGRMPACIWPQEYEADFVRHYLGPLFECNGVKTKIWLIDHNYNLWGRAIAELETPGVRKYASAIAWHGYAGQPEWIGRVHDAFPDVEMHWTEGGPDYTAEDYSKDWSEWSKTFTGILRNWSRSVTAWNFALDEKGRPNIGPFDCGGLLTINSTTKEISHSGQFWALAHYSRLARRGAHRFDSQSAAEDLSHAGFENPDGQCVLVLTNPGPTRNCEVRMGHWAAVVPLERDSVNTLAWR
ncbi:MAG: twin-arginine translocation signal domain-containing protein [Acidobacteriia bacterium]|nr:twin-arginine translocation signal domain-containing protein [Terriglobia bacterium]